MSDQYKRNVVRKHLLGIQQKLVKSDIWHFEQLLPYKDQLIDIPLLKKIWLVSRETVFKKLTMFSPTKILKRNKKTKEATFFFDYKEFLLLKEMENIV